MNALNSVLGRATVLAGALLLLAGCERPIPVSTQEGYRGTAMVDVQNPRLLADKRAANAMPEALPASAASGVLASSIYQNVPALGHLDLAEFTRLMNAMTAWVSPEEGCAYCHNPANLASEEKYTKVVSRRMIEMTQHINSSWKPHVAETGVTCYTCHRGNPVPQGIWFAHLENDGVKSKFAGNRAGQNIATAEVGMTSLPFDPFTTFLQDATEIRVVSRTALATNDPTSIKQTEWTYGLMMHMSQSLGVNCTHCHNSRSFIDWNQSNPVRVTAWYGIRLVRDLNVAYLNPLASLLPPKRLGVAGDGPKVGCATCHQGAAKPLYGAPMLADYTAFAAPPVVAPPAAMPVEAAPEELPEPQPAEPAVSASSQ